MRRMWPGCDDDSDAPVAEPVALSEAGSGGDTVIGAVAGTFRRSPVAAKLYFICSVVYIAGVLAWMAVSADGVLHRPPFYAAFMGGVSGIVLGSTAMLFNVAQGDRWQKSRKLKWGLVPKRMTSMLLALPVLAFCSGMLGAAATVLMVPFAAKKPIVLVAVIATLYVVGASVKMTADATRWLYAYARQQADAAERARAEASDAQLAALQAQVNPHFLFNALNTIAALVRTDPRAAEHTTENLARVLRRTLDRTHRPVCTVDDEIDYLRAWLAVERERYGERLRVDFDVDPAAADARIPTMTLQPLVENSLKHGIAGKLEGGRVSVCVRLAGERLRMEVEDDGAGFPRVPGEGTGLANLRRRLETLYGAAAELRVEQPPAGARVVVELPAAIPRVPLV